MCMGAKETFGYSNRGKGEFAFCMSNLQDSCHVDYVGAVCALRRLGEKPRRSGKPPLCKGRWHGEAVTEGLSTIDGLNPLRRCAPNACGHSGARL